MFSTEPAAEHLQTTVSTPSSSLSMLLLSISSVEAFKNESSIWFSLSHFGCIFFIHGFSLFPSFVSFFFVAADKKNSSKLRVY